MPSPSSLLLPIAFAVPTAMASSWSGWGGWASVQQGQGGAFPGPSCLADCWSSGSVSNLGAGPGAFCTDSGAIDSLNSCISGSSCSEDDKQGAYQVLAQACANDGVTLSARPEATYSATSGGSAWPTANSAWSTYTSSWAAITAAPTANGWYPGCGHGPFGSNAQNGGWGPWDGNSVTWTTGPWTSWWGGSSCPPSTWSGWTSGPWGTSPPWTSWAGCTQTTTGSSVVTSTYTTGGSTSAELTTAYGIQVAAASPTGNGQTNSGHSTFQGGKLSMVVGGCLAASLVSVMLL